MQVFRVVAFHSEKRKYNNYDEVIDGLLYNPPRTTLNKFVVHELLFEIKVRLMALPINFLPLHQDVKSAPIKTNKT